MRIEASWRTLLRLFCISLALAALGQTPGWGVEIQLTTFAIDHFNPQWSFDGQWIVYEHVHPSSGNIQICRVSANDPNDPNEHGVVIDKDRNHLNPQWSRDGKWVAFSRETTSASGLYEIWIARGDAQQNADLRQRSKEPGVLAASHFFPRWSTSTNGAPDADDIWLVFERALTPDVTAIYRSFSGLNIGLTQAGQQGLSPDIFLVTSHRCSFPIGAVPDEPEPDRPATKPVWSTNGTWISCFRTDDQAKTKLQRIDFRGHAFGGTGSLSARLFDLSTMGALRGTSTLAVETIDVSRGAEWKARSEDPNDPNSPPGQKLVCAAQLEGEADHEITVFPFDVGTGQVLTNNLVEDLCPVWYPPSAPDCNFILFTRGVAPNREIWVVHEDASGEIKVSIDNVDHRDPAWNPLNGFEVVYSKFDTITQKYQIFKNAVYCPLH